jgi:hypothetical protein
MGKRGPQPGTKYRKRALTTPRVAISTDAQLVAAQRFNERLDAVLDYVDNHLYPVNKVDARLIARLQGAAEVIQGAVCEGISAYYEADTPEARAALRAPAAPSPAALPPPVGRTVRTPVPSDGR